MDILNDLYDAANTHLQPKDLKWVEFTHAARKILSAHVVLYHTAYGLDKSVKSFTVIAATAADTMARYNDAKIYNFHQIPEADLAPLEPARRTDDFSDEVYRQLGQPADFLIENGMFYLLVVPAILRNKTIATLALWRGEDEADFTDTEKQVLALFMRHLVVLVDDKHLSLQAPSIEVSEFGSRWDLTDAETGVLGALLQGMSLKEIAAQSNRTYGTVRWHTQNILEKCQVNSQKALLNEFYQLIRQ